MTMPASDRVDNGERAGRAAEDLFFSGAFPAPPAESSVPTPEFRTGLASQTEPPPQALAQEAALSTPPALSAAADQVLAGGDVRKVSDLDAEGFDDFSYWRPNLKVPLEPVES
jgi:hypothetical protein